MINKLVVWLLTCKLYLSVSVFVTKLLCQVKLQLTSAQRWS